MSVKFVYNHNKYNSIGEELKQLVVDAKDEIIIVAPYISKNPLIDKIDALDRVKIRILTRLSLDDFISSSSDINIISKLMENPKVEIRYYSNLHAKIYIVDGKKAIVTSANFTRNGMYNNLEYGVLIEENLTDMIQDINNLWSNAGIVNDAIIASIQDELNILEENEKQVYKLKNEINQVNRELIEVKRSHPYKREILNKEAIVNSIPEYEALDSMIGECDMENVREKILKIYELIKNNIPEDVRKSCAFRYRKNNKTVDVAMNIMNYRIFLLPDSNKPIVQIIYPKKDIYNLSHIVSQDKLNISEEWVFKNIECYILCLSFDEILELKEVHWKSFKEACLIAYNGKKSRNRDSNMIVDWEDNENRFYIIDEKKNVYATGRNLQHGFIVLKDSKISKTVENSLKGLYFDLREKLITDGIIVENGNEMIFAKDYKFTKSSPAASVVLGRNETGMKYWKLKNGVSLGEFSKVKDE